MVVQRRAIRMRRPAEAGQTIMADDLECLRPCPPDAIDPRHLEALIGRMLAVTKVQGDAIRWTDLAPQS